MLDHEVFQRLAGEAFHEEAGPIARGRVAPLGPGLGDQGIEKAGWDVGVVVAVGLDGSVVDLSPLDHQW